jgi:hypothetical protein
VGGGIAAAPGDQTKTRHHHPTEHRTQELAMYQHPDILRQLVDDRHRRIERQMKQSQWRHHRRQVARATRRGQ